MKAPVLIAGVFVALAAVLLVSVGGGAWSRPAADPDEDADGLAPCPAPEPRPAPAPAGKLVRVLVIEAKGCSWCRKLRAEWPKDAPPTDWKENSQELADRWNVRGTPTLIGLDARGEEVRRQLGYLEPAKLRAWLAGTSEEF